MARGNPTISSGKEPKKNRGDNTVIELVVQYRDSGGDVVEEKKTVSQDGKPVTMSRLILAVCKYFNRKSIEVISAKARIVTVVEHEFTVDDEGEVLVDGSPADEAMLVGHDGSSNQELPIRDNPPAVVQTKPKKEPSVKRQKQVPPPPVVETINPPVINDDSGEESDFFSDNGNGHDVRSQLLATTNNARSERDERALQIAGKVGRPGLVLPTAEDVEKYSGAVDLTEEEKLIAGKLGGGRGRKRVPKGSQMASYAAEYLLFEPFPHERQRGISTICVCRRPKPWEYRPSWKEGDAPTLLPIGSIVWGVSFAVRDGSQIWEVHDRRSGKTLSVPDTHLVAPSQGLGYEPNMLDLLYRMPEKEGDGPVVDKIITESGAEPVYERIALENLDRQRGPQRVPSGMTLEQAAVAQAEQQRSPMIDSSRIRNNPRRLS
jgi:hypothetical protein